MSSEQQQAQVQALLASMDPKAVMELLQSHKGIVDKEEADCQPSPKKKKKASASSSDSDDEEFTRGRKRDRTSPSPRRSSESPNEKYRKSKGNTGRCVLTVSLSVMSVGVGRKYTEGGNKGLQTDGRKEVCKQCTRVTKKLNKKMASWEGDMFGMSKVLDVCLCVVTVCVSILTVCVSGLFVWVLA